jgi:hypothetical protein
VRWTKFSKACRFEKGLALPFSNPLKRKSPRDFSQGDFRSS